MLVDTHAHLHFDDYADDLPAVLERAEAAGIVRILSVGVNEADSAKAVDLASKHELIYATVGLHPHEADHGQVALDQVAALATSKKVVAIGECGLDFYKEYSPRDEQITALRYQINLASRLGKPLIFHVREAFDQLFELLKEFPDVQGVVHSFTSTARNMQQAVARGLYVSLNGIMTFTKDESQLEAARLLPLGRLILETDCPFLSPTPLRGRRNEPANIALTAKFLAELRGEDYNELCTTSTKNASELFGLAI